MSTLIRSSAELLSWRQALDNSKSVGLVPTMGNLHAGHASLIARSIADNNFTIVTIFVNPKQFGPNEDFASYPRTLTQDQELIDSLGGDVIIFAPAKESEIYPPGFSTTIEVKGRLTEVLCGAKRPGHFAGVTTVVYQLILLSKAHRAYFGSKDYQQLQVIKRMCTDLRLEIEVISMPITRDEHGLALSSRNQYLSEAQREDALDLSRTLKKLSQLWASKGEQKALKEREQVLASDNSWDYLEILDGQSFSAPEKSSKIILFAGARYFGSARLIDNLTVENPIAR